jgi:hypothetical protein
VFGLPSKLFHKSQRAQMVPCEIVWEKQVAQRCLPTVKYSKNFFIMELAAFKTIGV